MCDIFTDKFYKRAIVHSHKVMYRDMVKEKVDKYHNNLIISLVNSL